MAKFCCDFHLVRLVGGLIPLFCCDTTAMFWYTSLGLGVTTSCLKLGSLDWCWILLLFDVEDEVGDTEKSGEGLDTTFWCCDWRKFWCCSCRFDCPTIIRLLAELCDELRDTGGKLLPPLKRGYNKKKSIFMITLKITQKCVENRFQEIGTYHAILN